MLLYQGQRRYVITAIAIQKSILGIVDYFFCVAKAAWTWVSVAFRYSIMWFCIYESIFGPMLPWQRNGTFSELELGPSSTDIPKECWHVGTSSVNGQLHKHKHTICLYETLIDTMWQLYVTKLYTLAHPVHSTVCILNFHRLNMLKLYVTV